MIHIINYLIMPKEALPQSRKNAIQYKKNLDLTVDYMSKLLDHTVPSDDEDSLCQPGCFQLLYGEDRIQLPLELLQLQKLSGYFKAEDILECIGQEDRQRMLPLCPKGMSLEESLATAFTENVRFGVPADRVLQRVRAGEFTKNGLRLAEIQHKIVKVEWLQYLKQIRDLLQNGPRLIRKQRWRIEEDSDIEQVELQNGRIQQIDDQRTITEEQFQDYKNQIEEARENQLSEVFFRWQDRRKSQEELLASSEDRILTGKAKFKPTHYIKHNRSQKWVEYYRKQQKDRYASPHLPWPIICEDGRKVIVPAVAKKASAAGSKPRDHPLLKIDRPSCVNILTLVRDAAARLPSGIGTRADICQLLKQSQYVNENMSQQKMSTIVSGALDRLHYNSDSCVKYDSERKLWLFVQGEEDQVDQEYSTKLRLQM